MWFLHSLHCFDDCSFYSFYWITVYLVYYNWYLINNNNNNNENKNLMYVIIKNGHKKQINIKNRTYFYNDIIDIENFDAKLLKIDKNHTKTLIFLILDMSQRKKLVILKILIVLILCI